MYNFGFKVNSSQMLQLASSLDFKIIKKNKDNYKNLLALFAGQARLLNYFDNKIRDEYMYLYQKYSLKVPEINWKYSKIHPQNFLEKRIDQITKLIYNKDSLFEWVIENDCSSKSFYNEKEFLTEQTIDNIIINTIIPFQISYNQFYCKSNKYIIEKLKNIRKENNNLTRRWENLGVKIYNVYESQALIELSNNICQKKQCLNCPLFQ